MTKKNRDEKIVCGVVVKLLQTINGFIFKIKLKNGVLPLIHTKKEGEFGKVFFAEL